MHFPVDREKQVNEKMADPLREDDLTKLEANDYSDLLLTLESCEGTGVASRRSDDIPGFDRNARRPGAQCRGSRTISAKASGSAFHCRLHKEHNRDTVYVRTGVASRRSDDIPGFDRNARRPGAQCRGSRTISAKASGSAFHCRCLHKEHNRDTVYVRVARQAIRDWTNMKHKKYWGSLTGLRQAKGLIRGPSIKRAKELLKLNRNQLRWVVGLLTGHCHLKGHLFKLGLSDSPTCKRCQEDNETATHILCECEALAYLRLRHLGQYFMESSEYFDAPTYKILRFIRSAGLLRE
ncbi:hypothetical protein B7P43_G10162 [Cryptotermes secundus]|uniref:Reverse transcriptase zinc-binding domain-containing protein n=1 Tax=Cryptotermes secundus TaxID=105785 RepID=A0A2J7Q8I5_9NEOP|nr:hypothetical protein B7P43_G10162 [Cryptotermes secundus]